MTIGQRSQSLLCDERGVALPLAMFVLVLLTTLMLAFMTLSKSEPVIAANHARATEARALAESGVERVLWALTAGVIPSPTNPPAGTAATPYDGTQVIPLTFGGVVLTVTTVPDPLSGLAMTNERNVTSIGCVPGPGAPPNAACPGQALAHRRVQTVAMRLTNLAGQAPCALCVAGQLQVSGNSTIDGRSSTCGQKYGTSSAGSTAIGGFGNVFGSVDGNNTANQTTDYQQNVPAGAFNNFKLTPDDLDALRALAKANHTYFGTGFSGNTNSNGEALPGSYTGSVAFRASDKIKNGIVFIDTVSGNNPTATSNPADNAMLSINGDPFVGTSGDGIFKGWIISNGTLGISGNMRVDGMVYAANDLTYNGTGTGSINGLVISQNVQDANSTNIDSSTTGNSTITYNCDNVRGLGMLPEGWFVKKGTYREPQDP